MDIPFKKYESIANHNNQKTVDYYREQGFALAQVQWYATEKVHGTNFSFLCAGAAVSYAQRSGPITDSFFNYQANAPKLQANILALARQLGEPVQVFTEYYGRGIVNKGAIVYRNDDEKHFVAYDVYLPRRDEFVAYPENMRLLDLCGIPRVAVLATGTFDELLEFDTRFKSKLGAANGVDTFAEGVVLKPVEDLRLKSESRERVVLKRVSDEFSENKPKKVEKEIVEVDARLVQLIDARNTEVRLGKVAAKFGISPADKSRFANLIIELAKDISEAINAEEGVEADASLVKKRIVGLVKSYFQ